MCVISLVCVTCMLRKCMLSACEVCLEVVVRHVCSMYVCFEVVVNNVKYKVKKCWPEADQLSYLLGPAVIIAMKKLMHHWSELIFNYCQF